MALVRRFMRKTIRTPLALAFAAASICIAASVPDQKLLPWVQERVHQIEPKPQDRRMDEIGWAASITEALRLGREHGRPVFLFTHDGQVSTGRC